MKKRTNVILSLCMAAMFATTTGCGNMELTQDQKEAIEATKEEAKEVITATKEEAKEAYSQTKEEAKEAYSQTKEEAKDYIKEVKEEIKEAAEAGSIMSDQEIMENASNSLSTEAGILISPEDIGLTDSDGNGKNYTFQYDGEAFDAKYTSDNWKIYNSYKITNEADITIICQALIEEHPIHGKDMTSYRTADDMAYEWLQHNIAYALLSDDNSFKAKAKDVDLNPEDQGRTFEEFYKDRTGKELTIEDIMKYLGN